MKYLEALLARGNARHENDEKSTGGHGSPADKTAKTSETIEGTPFGGFVGGTAASYTRKGAAVGAGCGEMGPDMNDDFDPYVWGLEDFQERAAIMEYDGGLDRPEAERRALLEIFKRISNNTID